MTERSFEEDILLAKAHGDLFHWQHILRARQQRAARVKDRLAARREMAERVHFLWISLRVITGSLDWRQVAKTARRIAYLAEGFHAEEEVPTALAQVEEKQRIWDQVRPG